MNEFPEYEDSENKASLSEWKDAVISLAAFATSKGSTVHFGITPSGRKMGIQIGQNSLENLANDIKRYTDPPLFPSINVEGSESSAIVHVTVEESPIKPVWAFGKPYKRVGRTNQALSRDESQRLVEETLHRTWDALPCPYLQEEDLDRTTIDRFLAHSSQDQSIAIQTVIKNLRLKVPNGMLCNAAALLFAQDLRPFFTGAYVKCARFKDDSGVEFLDERSAEGNIFEQVDTALAFITRNTQQSIEITGLPERKVISEYPEAAIREALINAVCHRDYGQAGHVQVRIFPQKLEISNPGELPIGLTLDQLFVPHHSYPRNRIIADALYRARFIEQWGTGTTRILLTCKELGFPTPHFEQKGGRFIVTLFSRNTLLQTEELPLLLTPRQRETLAYVRQNKSITSAQYKEMFSVSARQAGYDLGKMVSSNLLRRHGKGRSIIYTIP